VLPDLPSHLQIEVTSACNLRCAMCLVRYRPPVNKVDGAFDAGLLTRLLAELPGLRRLTLQGLGEPLLHPGLIEMVRQAHERGIQVGFNSNATLLTPARSRALVAAGLDWLHVSVDGATAATFDRIREGAQLPTVLANLRGLVAAKREANRDTPWIRVVFVAMRRNVTELPDLVGLLADIGVSELRVQNLSHDFTDTDPAGAYQEIRRYAEEESLWHGDPAAMAAFDAARTAAAAAGLSLRLPEPIAAPVRLGADALDASAEPGRPGCTWPWEAAYITSRGVVQPCCMVMGDDRVALGDLREQSFAEVWASQAYLLFRSQLKSGPAPPVCRGCALYQGSF
ncbi:MAG TPA: radical SAM protein, partial [Micromonosporaceae bacterium]